MYPSILSAFNISKETTLSTTFEINGFPKSDVEIFFSNVTSPEINSVFLCNKFFDLPNYQDMEQLYIKYLGK